MIIDNVAVIVIEMMVAVIVEDEDEVKDAAKVQTGACEKNGALNDIQKRRRRFRGEALLYCRVSSSYVFAFSFRCRCGSPVQSVLIKKQQTP